MSQPFRFPGSRSEPFRTPRQPRVEIAPTLTETTGLRDGWTRLFGPEITDLTVSRTGVALGQRIIVSGRVLDARGRPVPRTLIELWQANAAGRYAHLLDQWDAPHDPNFQGVGRVITDDEGGYRFVTVRPGAYPWGPGASAWRPSHIHMSLLGPSFASRIVTQMYFPDDPLIVHDPIAQSAPPEAVARMISRLDLETTQANYGLGYRFDIVLGGACATPQDPDH